MTLIGVPTFPKCVPDGKDVDKWVAHRDRRPTKRVPTYADLNRAIDCLGEMLTRYTLLLENAYRPAVVPMYTGDVMALFRVAWLPPLGPRTISAVGPFGESS